MFPVAWLAGGLTWHPSEPEWTKAETDYLMGLVKEYDARFYVINDRYDYATGGVERSIDVSRATKH